MSHHISALSYIHPQAQLGRHVTIEPFAYIDQGTVIGDNTHIGPHVTVYEGTTIGSHCRVFPGAVIGAVPQDLKFDGEATTVVIGDRTTIRECATINRGTRSRGSTVVGNDCLIMAYAHVAHDCTIGNHVILVNAVQVAGEVEIGDWAIIGGTSAVHQFVRIGEHAMVSGGSLVGKDVPPFVKTGRSPLAYMGINSVGLKRRGFTLAQITEIQDVYRIIFQQGYNLTTAINAVANMYGGSELSQTIVGFASKSQRGIIKSYAVHDKASEKYENA